MSKPTPKFIAFVCVFVTLITLTSSTLSVYNLQALGQSDQTLLNISYSIANYGFVPLGKTIVGKLVHSPKFGDECTPQVETDVDYDNKFMLIPRGKCEFVTKTLNAQKLGAQLAIIMDDQEHSNLVIMKDNGYGHKANIPSIFINYKDGQKLKKLLQENEGEEDAEVIMKITFHSEKTDKVSVNFYLQANNRHSYRFVQTFTKFYPKIKDDIDLTLVYYNIKCPECLATDCYNEKAYCAINYVHEQSANGRLILDQQIREQLVWRSYPEKWWKYMKQIGDQCNSISQLQACQERALKKVGIDPAAFKNVFKTSFGQGEYHQLLVEDQEHLAVAGINRYPAVTLNNQKLKGSLHAEFVFDDICNLLKSPPQECTKYVESKTIIQTKVENNWLTLILVITLGVITFSIIFCLYRRHMKKKISKEMQGRVDDMVSKYIEFYSQRSKS